VTPSTGDIWLADLGAETRRPVYVISDDRFHRLTERAVIAPLLAAGRAGRNPPWWITHDGSVVAVDRLASIPVDRLLERSATAQYRTVRAVQAAIGWLTGLDR
jgi:mRNA-degrading endonuclease toxin of MazEF toxin-antitoxin module